MQNLRHRVFRQVVLHLGEFEHVDERASLRVGVRVGPPELEPRLLHQLVQVRYGLLTARDRLELRGVLAGRVVGEDYRRRRVLDVPLGELGTKGRNGLPADGDEDVREDRLAGYLAAQPVSRSPPPPLLVPRALPKPGPETLL